MIQVMMMMISAVTTLLARTAANSNNHRYDSSEVDGRRRRRDDQKQSRDPHVPCDECGVGQPLQRSNRPFPCRIGGKGPKAGYQWASDSEWDTKTKVRIDSSEILLFPSSNEALSILAQILVTDVQIRFLSNP